MQWIPVVCKVAVLSCFFLNGRALFIGHCAEWPPKEAVSGHSPIFRPKCLVGLTELTGDTDSPTFTDPRAFPSTHSSPYLVFGKSVKIFTWIPFTGLCGIQQSLPQGSACSVSLSPCGHVSFSRFQGCLEPHSSVL